MSRPTPDEIRKVLKELILTEFLPGEDPSQLTDATPLITSGIIDSLAVLKLVSMLEQQYGIQFAAHEVDAEHFDTIEKIADLVLTKA
jgi:acyl carrier protein